MDFKSALVIILFFIAFFAFLTIFLSNRYKQMADAMISQYSINTQFAISNVLADVYTMGRPPGFDHFKRCNIYIIENGILLVGYSQFWNKKIYAKPLILLKNDSKINIVNPNSFNDEVYIEIVYVSKNFQQSAEIRLKGLSDQDRNLFNVLVLNLTKYYIQLVKLHLNIYEQKSKERAKKSSAKKNKLGVKNSLVNNINARKRKGKSRPKKKSTVTKSSYKKLKNNWGKKRKKKK